MLTRKLTFSSLVIALYIVIMLVTKPFAYGMIQIRLATSLYALAAAFPFLIIPLGIANAISNVFGGMLLDVIGGFFVGILTATLIYLIKKFRLNDWFIILPLIFSPGLIVPIWLAPLIGQNYFLVASFLCIGQVIPAILGVILYKEMKKRLGGVFNGEI